VAGREWDGYRILAASFFFAGLNRTTPHRQ